MKIQNPILFIFLTLSFPFSAQASDWKDTGLLFHAGFRPFLESDIQANGISEDVWKTAIFGKTGFDLPDYRMGLYGAMSFSGTSLYSLYQTLGSREPWVMVIQVKSECRVKSSMFYSDYSIQLNGPGGRFSDWYLKHRAKYKSLEKFCLEKFGDITQWKEGALYSVSDQDKKTQEVTTKCAPVLNEFLNDEGIKLVFDLVNENSWYIRDRECIQSISGTADQLLDLVFSNRIGDSENDVMDNLYGDVAESGTFFGGSTLMMAKIVAETNRLDSAHAANFSALIRKASDYVGKLPEGKNLSIDSNEDNPYILRHVWLGALGSILSGQMADFQKQLKNRLDEMTQTLGNVCQDARGVPNDRRAACSSATAGETGKLIQILKAFEAIPK